MLILAGVSINLVLGNNGIVKKAQEPKKKKIAEIYEKLSDEQSGKFIKNNTYLTKYEVKKFLEKNGVIENNNIKIDNEEYSIQDILGKYSNKYTSKYVIAGYWENYVSRNPIKLFEISPLYEIINITFARDSGNSNGGLNFELNKYLSDTLSYSKDEFKKDIISLQNRGKKVLISIGGTNVGNICVTNDDEANNFASSLIEIIDEYNFNGMDSDIETGKIDINYFEKAILAISNNYGSNLMITLNSSLTGMRSADVNNGTDNMWYKFAADMGDTLSIVSARYYNSGTQRGYDYDTIYSREQGHISFITSIIVKKIEDKKISNGNIGITILSFEEAQDSSLPNAYLRPDEIVKALQSIIEGKDLQLDYKNFVPSRAYPELKSVTIWNINEDAKNNYEMAKSVNQYFQNLMN